MKRQRGRGRKPGGGHGFNPNQPNRTIESNGPEQKVRGSAASIYERYLQLARDASSSGDRVLSENYLQHADHYFRLLRQMQPAMPPPDRFASEMEFEGGEDDGMQDASQEGSEPDMERQDTIGSQQQGDQGDGHRGSYEQRGEGDFRGGRRGRRNRFRPGGPDAGGEPREGEPVAERADEEPRAPRPERSFRADRGERRPRGRSEEEPQEGFSSGPKPAFLGGD